MVMADGLPWFTKRWIRHDALFPGFNTSMSLQAWFPRKERDGFPKCVFNVSTCRRMFTEKLLFQVLRGVPHRKDLPAAGLGRKNGEEGGC